ncbi:MAG: 3-oxoacyl-[acyl-carrier protein] reductase, partial [uncultured Friedmanniella sp.]
ERIEERPGHRGEQGHRVRDRSGPRRAGLHRGRRRPGRDAAGRGGVPAARRRCRRLRRPAGRHRRRERHGRGRAGRGAARAARRPGEQRRHHRRDGAAADDGGPRRHPHRGGDQRARGHPGHQRHAAAAAPLAVATDRQRVQRGRVAGAAVGPRHRHDERAGGRRLLPLEDLPERGDAPVRPGARRHEHPDQRRLPRLRRDRPQRIPRRADPPGGRGYADPPGHPARRRPHRRLLRGRRRRPLV